MGNLSIATKIPSHSEAYVFGSVLNSLAPDDFDLLIVYDPEVCPPQNAYVCHSPLCEDISIMFRLPVHLTALTRSEAMHVRFIEKTNALPLEMALEQLSRNLPLSFA